MDSTWVGSVYLTFVEVTNSDKQEINYNRKKFYDADPCTKFLKAFYKPLKTFYGCN